MRAVVIGGSGHIGTYLIPLLVDRGHQVINISRGERTAYLPNAAWNEVQAVKADRSTEDAAGTFGARVRDLKPDVVIDLICFTEASARQITEALHGSVQHFLHCGTIWIYGHSTQVPAREDQARRPFGEYGIQKAAIEAYLLEQARRSGFPATILHAGHIVGPGYVPINPQGNINPEVYARVGRGETLTLPNFGMETLHHVHAADVAQAFMQAISHWSASVGESFHTVSPAALTLRGYAEAMFRWFGREPKLEFLDWEAWRETVSEADAQATWEHIVRSPNASISKAQRLINYQPRYSSLEAVQESVQWLLTNGVVKL